MRNLHLAEMERVSGAGVSINVRPGETNVLMTEKSDQYSIYFYKNNSSFFTSNSGYLTMQGDGTYSWGASFWGTPYPDFFPTQVNADNGAVTFKVSNAI